MEETKTLNLQSNLAEVAKVEWFIGDFCKKYRLYDEYFGSMLRATDIILQKIMGNNEEQDGEINLTLTYDNGRATFEFVTSTYMVAAFELSDSKEDLTLQKLTNSFEVMDSNKVAISFNINSLHQQEWVRRRQLMNKYYKTTRKEA